MTILTRDSQGKPKNLTLAAKTSLTVILLLVGGLFVAATTTTSNRFTETGVSNGDGEWQYMAGTWTCHIWSTSWDGASVDMETLVTGTTSAPTYANNVNVSSLVGVTSDSPWATLIAGPGYYRVEVSGGGGSESINWQCRQVGPQ